LSQSGVENKKCAEIVRYSFIWHNGTQDPLDRFSQSFHRIKAFWVQMIDLDLFFSPLGKLVGRAIYFTDVFSLFFIFLVVASGASLAQKPMDRSSPKFQDW